jgi:cytidylate kinase
MNQADVVRRYLHEPRDVDFHDTGFPFITISRQAGTEAHALGRFIIMRLAKYDDLDLKSGWDLFDQKLCALIAQNKSLEADYDTLVNEGYRADGIQRMVYEMLIGTSQQYKIQKKIEEVVHLLARLGKVVIIGRGGFHLTRGMPGGIHVRLVAPLSHRVLDVMEHDKIPEDQARQKIKKADEERAGFLKRQYGCDPDDPTQFDFVCNVARVPVPEIVETIAELVRRRLRHLRQTGAIQAL